MSMAGELGREKVLLRSTVNDIAEREATLLILGIDEIQIEFTACESKTWACDFTPVGDRVIVEKKSNIMEASVR
jgi:hypothetical protein